VPILEQFRVYFIRFLAEREGFEPPIALRLCLISSQVHSTGLCHLSVFIYNDLEDCGNPPASLVVLSGCSVDSRSLVGTRHEMRIPHGHLDGRVPLNLGIPDHPEADRVREWRACRIDPRRYANSGVQSAMTMFRQIKYMVPRPLRHWLNVQRQTAERAWLHVDRVTDWSVLRRVRPYRKDFGARRGECIDRFYIEKFLAIHQESIRGRVAEMQADDYTRRFGGDRIEHSDVIDIDTNNPRRTLTLDLAQPTSAPADLFDCIICTQALNLIHDYRSAIRSLHKMLKTNGTLLVTVPGICQRIPPEMRGGGDNDWWRFVGSSAGCIFGEIFSEENVAVETYGNVLTAVAFLHGLVQEELTQAELNYHDPDFEVIVAVKATKSR
jgi:SAM-dependent methyltransferase